MSEAITTAIDASRWTLVLLAGVVGIAAGVVAQVYPDPTFFVISACLATYLLALISARLPAAAALSGLQGAQGLVGTMLASLILVGVLLFADAETAATLAIVVGLTMHVLLAVVLSIAIAERFRGTGRMLAATAVSDLVAGTALVLWAHDHAADAATVLGIYLVVRGVVDCAIALALRALRGAPPAPDATSA